MRLAHLADIHLGFKFGSREAAGGLNQRESDVANAFQAAVDAVIAAKPDVVGIAGDLFHYPKPTNHSIVFAFRQFRRLREGLPDVPIIIAAGNHDTGRSGKWNSILPLFADLGIDLAIDSARQFVYPALDLRVAAVPDLPLRNGDRSGLTPQGTERYRVLLLHGAVAGLYPEGRPDRPAAEVSKEEVTSEEWSYTALGDYHVQHQVGPRAWYSGSTEYTSTNIWGEIKKEGTPGKGWLLADLDTGEVSRQPLPLARMIHDLAPVYAEGMTAEQLNEVLADRIASIPGGIKDVIVRLKVLDVPRAIHRELDHKAINRWKAEALRFRLDLQQPRMVKTAGGQTVTIRESIDEKLARYLGARPLPPGMDRSAFMALGAEIMDSTRPSSAVDEDAERVGAA